MDDLDISVVVPTYNRSKWIKECLETIKSQSIDPKSFEIIVVDDGSTDDTEHVVSSIQGVRYFKQANAGPGNARNRGIQESKGKIIAFTDDDCIPDRDWLKSGLEALEKSGLDGIEGQTYTEKEKTSPLSVITYTYHGGGFMTANMFYKKAVLDAVGGFHAHKGMLFREDTDLAWRLMDGGCKLGFDPSPRVFHRVINYGLLGFLKKHLRLREIWWNCSLAKSHSKRYRSSPEMIYGLLSTQTMYHYIFLMSVLLSAICYVYLPISTFLLSLVILVQNYILVVFLHTRMKSGIDPGHVLRFKKEFAMLCLVWWVAILWDTAWKVAGNIRHRTVVL